MARLSQLERRRARQFRAEPTEAEKRLWSCLRHRQLGGAKFRRQFPIPPWIADFACPSAFLLIELDGGQHTRETDRARERDLHARGWQVLRFWNNDVLANTAGVLEVILSTLQAIAAAGPHRPAARPLVRRRDLG